MLPITTTSLYATSLTGFFGLSNLGIGITNVLTMFVVFCLFNVV